MTAPRLLKLSGEALKADAPGILDDDAVMRVCTELVAGAAVRPVAVVVGGGNVVRGAMVAGRASDPARGDYMGMLATLINALALRDGIERAGGRAEVMAPHAVPNVARAYDRPTARRLLEGGTVVIFGGGTGHPFLTTDTCAALRAVEVGAEVLLKGSKVDGVYDQDPHAHADAERFAELSYDAAIEGRYGVMDMTAFALCRDHSLPIRVFDMRSPGAIEAALGEDPPGTLVH